MPAAPAGDVPQQRGGAVRVAAGSTMHVVWQQDRFADQTYGTAGFGSLGDTLSAPGDNIIVVKFTYWIPL